MGSLFSKADAGPPRQRGIIRRRGAGDDLGPAPKRPRVQPAPKPARSLRRKKRKVALFVAYDGSRYHGMQVNKGVATIEGEVLAALVRCSLIPDDSRDTQTSIQWCRAARTDKGVSAACQCLSLRLACELSGQLDESIIDGLNEELPRDIAVIAILRTTASFSSRVDCHRRTYEYVFPVRVLGGANGVERREDGRDGDARIARLNELLGQYVGTHCFANFTEGLESSDEASKRYMIRVAASEPFLAPDGATYLTAVVLRGQSFVIYQIRKMVGLALAVFSGAAPPEAIQVTPTAPALGLLLDEVEFSSYNKQAGKGLASPVTVDGPIRAAKDAFKRDVIHRHIAEEELSTGSMMSWMQSVRQRMRYDAEKIRLDHQRFVSSSVGIEEERRRVIAAQFPVTRDRGEFLGSGDRAGDEATCARLDELLAKFRDLTSLAPKCIVRAPGRVNLIGEHCDYNSFPVIGVATRQGTLLVGAQSLDPRVSVMHVDAANFGAGSFGTNGRGVVWEGEQADWCSYVSWGWTAMMENIGAGGRKAGRGCGARVLVSGDLPRAAGLGSSSSLVTASAMMAARLNRVRLGREELALVAAEGERVGAGTRGGAVDHTVSMCGVKAAAVLVSFSPKLEAVTMPLPRSASFVVVNSGVHAFKGQHDGTKALFNTRVIECRVGAAIVARRLRTHLSVTVSTPGQLFNMERAGGRAASVGRLIERVSTVLGPTEALTLDEAVAELGLERESAEWKERFLLGIEVDPGVRLEVGRRMAHVLSEAERVERFRAVLESFAGEDSGGDEGGVIGELGALLSASHVSLRDNYACSIREVDALVEFCVGQGSVGSRITGAGWGGCVLSLVPDQFLSTFLGSLRGRLGHAAVFVAEPSAGASVLAM